MKVIRRITLGRAQVADHQTPCYYAIYFNGKAYATCDMGTVVTFSELPEYKFFLHRSWANIEHREGAALTEASTGRRVAWGENDSAALDAGEKRLRELLATKGLFALQGAIASWPKISELKEPTAITIPKDADEPIEDRTTSTKIQRQNLLAVSGTRVASRYKGVRYKFQRQQSVA